MSSQFSSPSRSQTKMFFVPLLVPAFLPVIILEASAPGLLDTFESKVGELIIGANEYLEASQFLDSFLN